MYRKTPIWLLASCIFIFSNFAYADKQPQTEQEKVSYALGVQVAANINRQAVRIDTESFIQAIQDVLNKTQLKLSVDEMQQTLISYADKKSKLQSALAEKNEMSGKKFLTGNKAKKDVVELPSGLQYKTLIKGDGKKPTLSDTVVVHYRGTLIDGKEFDSSYKRGKPATFPLKNIIKGWQEALTMMEVGSKWQIYVPPDLAYGKQGSPPIIFW